MVMFCRRVSDFVFSHVLRAWVETSRTCSISASNFSLGGPFSFPLRFMRDSVAFSSLLLMSCGFSVWAWRLVSANMAVSKSEKMVFIFWSFHVDSGNVSGSCIASGVGGVVI